jgi:hypothetical protein
MILTKTLLLALNETAGSLGKELDVFIEKHGKTG